MTAIASSPQSIPRSAAAAAASLTVLYILCWIGAVVGVPVTHMWIQGFTYAPVDSLRALGEGVLWSLIAGAVVGATAAFFYNLFGALRR